MEHARLVIAIILSFIIVLVWQHFFGNQQAPQQASQTESREAATETPPMNATVNVSEALKPDTKAENSTTPTDEIESEDRKARTIRIQTPFYDAEISEKGGVVTHLLLKKYYETTDTNSPFKEIVSKTLKTGTLSTKFNDNAVPGMGRGLYKVSEEGDLIEVKEGNKDIVFQWKSPQGVSVVKTYRFSANTYKIGYDINIENNSDRAIRDDLAVSIIAKVAKESGSYGFQGPSAIIDKKLKQIDVDDIEDKSDYKGKIRWLAIEERYFMAALIPKDEAAGGFHLSMDDDILEERYLAPKREILPGQTGRFEFSLFFGPKSTRVLKSLNYDLERAIRFGFFDFIAKPCVIFMNFFHDNIIANYGVAIIVLTILTKILLWPLGNKSYKSMNEMKKIQPLITKIREQYKDDKKRMNEETMALYKTYKVNPLGGCLPMLAQIPVFFALYQMLYSAIELRHAPFFGWIQDLSAPDRLFHFEPSFHIPFMQPPYGIPVLTIIMGGTMLLQQKMSPPMGDPTQAKMMLLMPVVFTFIFINFSSGLVLYWLVNNILSISQQYYVQKKKA